MVPEYELDEVRQIIEGSYRIIYLVKEGQSEILSVLLNTREEMKPIG